MSNASERVAIGPAVETASTIRGSLPVQGLFAVNDEEGTEAEW